MTTIKPVSSPTRAAMNDAPLHLEARSAAEMMTKSCQVIDVDASVREAAHMLAGSGLSALPVVERDGRLAGVISRADIVRYESERDDCYERDSKAATNFRLSRDLRDNLGEGFHVEVDVGPRVSALMTPIVLAVSPETPARMLVETMLERRVHRLFVVDRGNKLLGVVSTTDLLRHLVS